MTKNKESKKYLSFKQDDTENVSYSDEEFLDWNEALEYAYETFMYDLKESTSKILDSAEWLNAHTHIFKTS